jgi:hypothetical protein
MKHQSKACWTQKVLIANQQAIPLFKSVKEEARKTLNSLVAGQLLGGVLFLIGVVLAAWSTSNNQPMGQLFGGALKYSSASY